MDDHNFIWTITFILVIISQFFFFFFGSRPPPISFKNQSHSQKMTRGKGIFYPVLGIMLSLYQFHNWYWIFLNRILNMNQKEPPTRGQTRRGFAELVAMHGHARPWSRCRFQISTVVQDPCLICMASLFSRYKYLRLLFISV